MGQDGRMENKHTLTPEVIAEAARMLNEVNEAVRRGDLTARRGERDRLRGATLALSALTVAR